MSGRETEVSGSRILLRPGRTARLRRDVPEHGRLPAADRWMILAGVHLRRGIQIEDTGGIRIVLTRLPAASPLRRDRRSASPSGDVPRTACAAAEEPVPRQPGRPCRRQMRMRSGLAYERGRSNVGGTNYSTSEQTT